MNRLRYVEFLDRVRERELARAKEPDLLASTRLPRKAEATERVRLRLTPAQRQFLENASASTHDRAVSTSAIVALGLSILEELDVPWANVASRAELVDVVRRRLRSR